MVFRCKDKTNGAEYAVKFVRSNPMMRKAPIVALLVTALPLTGAIGQPLKATLRIPISESKTPMKI